MTSRSDRFRRAIHHVAIHLRNTRPMPREYQPIPEEPKTIKDHVAAWVEASLVYAHSNPSKVQSALRADVLYLPTERVVSAVERWIRERSDDEDPIPLRSSIKAVLTTLVNEQSMRRYGLVLFERGDTYGLCYRRHYVPDPEGEKHPPGSSPVSPVQVCKSCGARIVFITSENGKAQPADAEEVDGDWAETLIVVRRTDAGGLAGVPFPKAPPTVRGRVSHFATCLAPGRYQNIS